MNSGNKYKVICTKITVFNPSICSIAQFVF